MPEFSIIIPVYNQPALTRQCLETLLKQLPHGPTAELIVVDDASAPPTRRMLDDYTDKVQIVTHLRNQGFATACNNGAAGSTGEILLFLNNDTIPTAGWLDALSLEVRNHPEALAFGARLLYPDGTVQHAGMAVCPDLALRHIYAGFPGDHPAVNKPRAFRAVTGACLAVRRPAFDAVGGFDPAYRNGFEDVDLCLKLGEQGGTIRYCPDAVLYHLESVSEGRSDRNAQNAALFRQRWADRLVPDDWLFYLQDGLIRVDYSPSHPFKITISPQLAVVRNHDDDGLGETEFLLASRARQVHELLRDNILMSVAALNRVPGTDPRLT